MMVDRAHQEHSLACRLERRYLNDNGQCFYDEYTADDDQEKLRFRQYGNSRQRTAERERTRIAHEYFRGDARYI